MTRPTLLFLVEVANGSYGNILDAHEIAQVFAPHHSSTNDADAQF
jgi:Cys-tRNA synthase (O-phospho-L-seryl-tRNA:Cys-tRNA synthase)